MLTKYAIKDVTQGYTGTQLQDDLKTLPGLRSEAIVNNKNVISYDEDVTNLIVGKACYAAMTTVDTELKSLFVKLKALMPDKVVQSVTRYVKDDENKDVAVQEATGELFYKMGPLKKISRITEKAAHYAICDAGNHNKPQLQQVRDILRATMVFPPGAWGEKGSTIGSDMIDAIDKHFDKNVVQVKNRFIHGRYPNFDHLNGVELPTDLERFIERTFKETLWGRDSFYRDLQLLILLKNDDFPNEQGMNHVILELQLASSLMYAAKTEKKGDTSGHTMYRNVRSVMEYCEFLWWKKQHKKNGSDIKLPNAAGYYNTAGMDFLHFATYAEAMAKLYHGKDLAWTDGVLGNAIDDSKWYARVGGK